MKPYLIASDPGIDDMVALLLMAKLAPAEKHCLIASFGNAPITYTGANAREFISFAAPTWTYVEGSALPLNGTIEHPWPDYFHGSDGVWGVHPQASGAHVNTLRTYPSYDRLISLCPFTDANNMVQQGHVQSATVMGGAFTIPGNETEYAETNIAFDVDAAAHFFDTCKHVRVVPLDVTRKVFWSIATVKRIPESSAQHIWIKRMLLTWFDRYDHAKEKDFNLHDPLAVYLTFFPEKAIWTKSGVSVVTAGKKRGQTILDTLAPACQVALDVPEAIQIAEEIFRLLFLAS